MRIGCGPGWMKRRRRDEYADDSWNGDAQVVLTKPGDRHFDLGTSARVYTLPVYIVYVPIARRWRWDRFIACQRTSRVSAPYSLSFGVTDVLFYFRTCGALLVTLCDINIWTGIHPCEFFLLILNLTPKLKRRTYVVYHTQRKDLLYSNKSEF